MKFLMTGSGNDKNFKYIGLEMEMFPVLKNVAITFILWVGTLISFFYKLLSSS
jgi:hypothetical protein